MRWTRCSPARNLPSLPQVLLKLIEACRNEEMTIRDIAQIVSGDSALSARILGIVNAPFYRRAEKIVRMDDALFQLGRDAVRSIAISASIHQVFSRVNGQSLFNMKLYWRHALLCAVLARRLSEKTSYKAPELSFLSGILHDVGRMVLWVNFPDEYGKVLQAARNQSEALLEGELKMGITHAEVGSWLLNRWGLDAFTADAARYHHEPLERIHNAFPLIKIIYAANILSDMPDSDFSRYKVIRELFGISFTDITEHLHKDQLFRAVFDAPRDAVFFFDETGIRDVNEAAAQEAVEPARQAGAPQARFYKFDVADSTAALQAAESATSNL